MWNWIKQLDGILRGDATRLPALREGRIDMPVGGVVIVAIVLAVIYGLCMGGFAVIRAAWPEPGVTVEMADAYKQMLASAVKLPLLFCLTLVVTFPSLYVFNALVGSRLSTLSVARLLVAMIAVMMAVLASLGPIVVFFSVSTTSYPFMKLLNVAMATIAGILGLAFLLRTLSRLAMVQDAIDFPPSESVTEGEDKAKADEQKTNSALDQIDSNTNQNASAVFKIWVLVFALVGAQMSWVLRPFIGSPDLEFTWFRDRDSNFFLDVIRSIGELFGA